MSVHALVMWPVSKIKDKVENLSAWLAIMTTMSICLFTVLLYYTCNPLVSRSWEYEDLKRQDDQLRERIDDCLERIVITFPRQGEGSRT